MPRPNGSQLDKLFGPLDPPRGWEQRIDTQIYFVHGLASTLRKIGKFPRKEFFLPVRNDVAAERRAAGWETAIGSKLWEAFKSQNQIKRVLDVRNNTFPTAANAILAVELICTQGGFAGDVYEDCYVVPQNSYIEGLTADLVCQWRKAVKAAGKNPSEILRQDTGQSEDLFGEMISGRLITNSCAKNIVTLIQKYISGTPLNIIDDFDAVRRSLQKLRRTDSDSASPTSLYKKKLTGANSELYLG